MTTGTEQQREGFPPGSLGRRGFPVCGFGAIGCGLQYLLRASGDATVRYSAEATGGIGAVRLPPTDDETAEATDTPDTEESIG